MISNSKRYIIKKCFLVFTVIMVLVLQSQYCFAKADKEDIYRRIYQYCESELGYFQDDLTENYVYIYKDGSCDFNFYIKNPAPMTNGFICGELNKDGTLYSIEGPKPQAPFTWFNAEIRRCLLNYRDIYQFKKEWESKLDTIPEDALDEFIRKQEVNPILEFLQHDIVLPDEKCIPYDEAKKRSLLYIESMNGWTKEMSENIDIMAEVVHIPSGMDHPVYQFIYAPAGDVLHEKTIQYKQVYTKAIDRQVEKLWDAETRVFGEHVPKVISVRVDAYTGEKVGDIYVEVPPVSRYAYIAIILWK